VPSPFAIQNSDGTRTLDFLDNAPASDTGQVAIPVRVISQLGAGTGGGSSGGLTDVELRAVPVPISGSVAVSNLPATQPVSGSVAVSNLPATQAVSGTVAISNLPATQPVSGSVAVNNFPATQPVSGPLTDTQLRASAIPVSGTFWPPTQPVSGAVSVSGPVLEQPANSAVSVTGAAAAAVTASLPAVAGQFHYISRINIIAYATAARTGAAAPVVVTSTNLPGSLAWTTPTAAAIGTQYETDIQLTSPLKSSAANVATTIVAPATASVIWRINVIYYTGP